MLRGRWAIPGAYYNDNDPWVAEHLRRLIAAGVLPPGDVDDRSIVDVQPGDLAGYSQCHFFAGGGGWAYALRLAGWPDDRPIWTGSCPCQPFSVAGKRRGTDDARHLWPEFYRLIAECRPPVVAGEQVAGRDGRAWLAGVRADLEAAGYAVGAVDLPAASVAAPHRRNRLFWIGDRGFTVADPDRAGLEGIRESPILPQYGGRTLHALADASGELGGCGPYEPGRRAQGRAADRGAGGLADDAGIGRDGRLYPRGSVAGAGADGRGGGRPWDRYRVVTCIDRDPDGRWRQRRIPVEPELFPLAHGLPARMGPNGAATPPPWRKGLIREYGNAIVPQVAAAFIRAYLAQ